MSISLAVAFAIGAIGTHIAHRFAASNRTLNAILDELPDDDG